MLIRIIENDIFTSINHANVLYFRKVLNEVRFIFVSGRLDVAFKTNEAATNAYLKIITHLTSGAKMCEIKPT